MGKYTTLLICIMLLCGCTTMSFASSSMQMVEENTTYDVTSATQPTNPGNWHQLKDLSGETIDFSSSDIVGIDLGYLICWNFDRNGYQKKKKGDMVNDCEVVEFVSNYAISSGNAVCNQNQLTLGKTEVMTGIIKVSQYDVTFYPYPNSENDNFVFLGGRTDEWEKKYLDESVLSIDSNKTATVQPIPILVMDPDKNGTINKISTFLLSDATDSIEYLKTFIEPIYLEADIQFSSITFRARNMGDGIEDTVGNGHIGWLTEAGGEGNVVIRSKL